MLVFVPWDTTNRPARLSSAQVAVVGALIVVQAWASLARVEMEPFVSDYPMYNWTYESPEAFNDFLSGAQGRTFDWQAGRFMPSDP